MKDKISTMIEAAVGGDMLTDEGGGFVSIMGKSSPSIRQDIPAAFEAYTLLSHFLDRLPVRPASLEAASPISDLSPAILHDAAAAQENSLRSRTGSRTACAAIRSSDGWRADPALLHRAPRGCGAPAAGMVRGVLRAR